MGNKVVIEAELATKSFERQIDEVEARLEEIDHMLSHPKEFMLSDSEIAKLNVEAEKLNNKLSTLYQKQIQLSQSHVFENIGKSISGVVKKVARWSIALIGIRTVIGGIGSAMSILTQDNEELGAQVDYMKWALATALKPVIEWIIKALFQIAKMWAKIIYTFTGYNIFKDSGIEDYQKSMEKSNKSAKALKKTLTGFDEMNVLNADGSTGGGVLPSPEFDVSDIEDFGNEVTQVAENITDKWFQLGNDMRWALDNPEFFSQTFGDWGMLIEGLVLIFMGLWDVVTGFIEVVGGVMDIIVGIFTGNFDLIKEGWDMLCKGLWDIFKGLLEIIVGLLESALGLVWGLIKEAWDVIWGLLSGIAGLVYDWIIKPIGDFINNGVRWVKTLIINFVSFAITSFLKIVDLFKNVGAKVAEAIGGAFKAVINGVLNAIENILNFPIRSVNKLIDTINAVPGINLGRLNEFKLPRLAKGAIASYPGRGIPTVGGGANWAEAGQEAYLPLTDEQIMSTLGQSIGKYITVNLTNVTELDGRTIARKVQEVNNGTNFLMNR